MTLFKVPYQRRISMEKGISLVDTVLPRKYHEKILLFGLCNRVLCCIAQDTFNNYITKTEFVCRGNEVKSRRLVYI